MKKKRDGTVNSDDSVQSKSRKCPVKLAFTQEGKIYVILCGSWNCPVCARKNARMWAWRVRIHVSNNGSSAFFWTLTLGSGFRTASQGFDALPRLFDRFRKTIKREVSGWSYCAFVEGQPRRGYMPHFHIISIQRCPSRLKDVAVNAGFGYQAKEEIVTDDKASFYVAKYATKQSPYTPRGFRRVRTSQDWAKLPDGDWPELVLWKADQPLIAFLLEVNYYSGVDVEILYNKWSLACEDYGLPNG